MTWGREYTVPGLESGIPTGVGEGSSGRGRSIVRSLTELSTDRKRTRLSTNDLRHSGTIGRHLASAARPVVPGDREGVLRPSRRTPHPREECPSRGEVPSRAELRRTPPARGTDSAAPLTHFDFTVNSKLSLLGITLAAGPERPGPLRSFSEGLVRFGRQRIALRWRLSSGKTQSETFSSGRAQL